MAASIEVTCPNCTKVMKVPTEVVGKLIRCKACSTTFEVVDPNAPKVTAKPKPKPAAPAKPKAKADADAPIKFKEEAPPPAAPKATDKVSRPFDDDDDDDGASAANPYGVTKDDLDVPRCPFCAVELDPPDTAVCLECGYDLIARKRHGSKKVYDLTKMDYFIHWLPAIAWIIVISALFGLAIGASLNMRSWLTGTFLESDEENPTTKQKTFFLPPFCFNIWIWIFCLFIIYKGARFVIRRLVYDWKPMEVIKKT